MTQRLRQLERDGLAVRTYHAEAPRVEYETSELGRSLEPFFGSLHDWTKADMHDVEQARERYGAKPQSRRRNA